MTRIVHEIISSVTSKINKADRPANSRERWAGALMEVRSLFGLNSAVKKNALRTDRLKKDGLTDGQTDPLIESRVRD